MNVNDVMKLVNEKYPDYTIEKITSVEKYFLVGCNDKGTKRNKLFKMAIPCDDKLLAVDKKTGDIFTYNPVTAARGGYD